MRIIGGKFGGRLLKPNIKSGITRPTTDIAKEALFNIIQNRFRLEEMQVLDLFAGTGNIAFECVSRGCANVTMVERHFLCQKFISSTIASLKIENSTNLIKGDVFKVVVRLNQQYDLIFCDPPYDHKRLTEIPSLIFENDLLTKDGCLILEHGKENDFGKHNHFNEVRGYGQTRFSFFS